jgi:carbohydrate diacid regulator
VIDNKIMYEIVEKLHERFSASISICDVSGRVIVSTDSSCMGEMNLLAIEALNINSKATASMDSRIQKAGAAMPICFQKSRLGAVVIQGAGFSSSQMAELLSKTIELLYEELILSKKKQNRTQERDQFLYEWLHLQSDYTENFIKRGEHLGINIMGEQTIILMERQPNDLFASTSIIQNLLDDRDILLPLSQDQNLIILKENEHFKKKFNRVVAAGHNCHTGMCPGSVHLHTAYQAALESLRLGKILFPDEHLHSFEKMKLAIALSRTDIPGLEESFSLLVAKGKNAQLAETAITYIRLNGDIQKICEKLHIHRNSIPYRIRRIQEICGRNLMDSYDLLYLFASFIRYAGKEADVV